MSRRPIVARFDISLTISGRRADRCGPGQPGPRSRFSNYGVSWLRLRGVGEVLHAWDTADDGGGRLAVRPVLGRQAVTADGGDQEPGVLH